MQDEKISGEDIDLRELFKAISNSKSFIIIFTFVITLFSIIYISTVNTIPIYKGSLLVGIGEIKIVNFIDLIEKPNDLKYILEAEGPDVKIDIPRKTNKIIKIIIENADIEIIKMKINTVYDKLIDNQKEKLNFSKEYIPTKKIGKIIISDKPINEPKKKLIITVSFVTALILSIFIVFFMQFIKKLKEEQK